MSPLRSFVFFFTALTLGAVGDAYAYDCAETTPREWFDRVSDVFEARVLRARRTADDPDGTVTLRVLRVFKGTTVARTRVELRWHGADPLPSAGRRFVATAHRAGGRLRVAICAWLTSAQASALSGRL